MIGGKKLYHNNTISHFDFARFIGNKTLSAERQQHLYVPITPCSLTLFCSHRFQFFPADLGLLMDVGRFSQSLQGPPLSLCLKEVGPPGLVSDTLAWPASQQTWHSKASSDLEEMRTTEIGNCIAAPHLSPKTSFRGRMESQPPGPA